MTYLTKIWTGFLLLLLCISQLHAQGPKEKKAERIQALWVAYVTQELDLSSEESAAFWPIYNDYKEQEKRIKKQKRQVGRQKPQNVPEAEIDQYFNDLMSLEEEGISLKRNTYNNLKTAIPAYKVIQLPGLEREFKKKILKFTQERRAQKDNRGGRKGGRGRNRDF